MAWWDDYIAAWDAHDVERIVSFMTPDAVYTDVAIGAEHTGRPAISAWIDGLTKSFSSDYRMSCTFGFATDKAYTIEWTMSGTQDGTMPDRAPTGEPFSVRGVSVGTLEDGAIRVNRDYWNVADFLIQIGALPPPV